MGARSPPWSDLPQELLTIIANFLASNPISLLTFRSVCRSWRSSCPHLSNSSILSPNSYYNVCHFGRRSFLSVTTICAFYRPLEPSLLEFSSLSPDACVLFVDEYIPGKLSIRKPFSTESYRKPINFPNLNMLDFNVRELGRFYNLTYSTNYDNDQTSQLSKPRFCDRDVKVIMFRNATAAIILNGDGALGMCRFDVGVSKGIVKCESKHDGKGFRIDDIIEFKDRVFGVDRRGRVYEIKYHSSKMTSFVAPIAGGGGRRKRLVESLGLLYLVVRCNLCKVYPLKNDRRTKFKVYELNEGRKTWVEITSLGDRSFSASARELGPCVKNCILFSRHSFLSYNWKDDNHIGDSKLKNNELDIGVCQLHDAERSGAIESYSGYSDSIWPPPSWIWPIDRLKRIRIVETAIDEILDRIPENLSVEGLKADVEIAWNHYYDSGQPAFVSKDLRVILKLKKMVIGFQEEEIEFMTKLRKSMDILNKDSLFKQARTAEERLGWLDMLGNFKTDEPTHDHLLHSAISMLRKRDATLFYIEEQATAIFRNVTEVELQEQLADLLTLQY